MVLLTVVEKFMYGERSSPADTGLIEIVNLENAYSVCIFVGERIEQAVVDDAEDDGRSANAESEGKDGDEGEAAVFAKAAEGEARSEERRGGRGGRGGTGGRGGRRRGGEGRGG